MIKKRKGQVQVSIYRDWCKGCGLCVAFCGARVYALDEIGKAQVVREEECVNCGFCELHCPDFAIVVAPKRRGRGQLPEPLPERSAAAETPPPPLCEPGQSQENL